MQNWLRRQNSFTKWTAIGTATSAAAGMVAVAALVIAPHNSQHGGATHLLRDRIPTSAG